MVVCVIGLYALSVINVKATLYDVKSVMACRTCAKLYYPLQENKIQRDSVSQFLYYDRLLSKACTELNPKFKWAFYSYLRYEPITLSLHNNQKACTGVLITTRLSILTN